nr:MAG TPA: hypothetical protein [Bacteriophage sp.]
MPINFTVLSEEYVLYTLKQWISRPLQYLIKNLPYRYFNEFLVLYSDFSDSRQISLLRISS